MTRLHFRVLFLFLVSLACAAIAGCSPPLPTSLGGECELDSDCDAPLACRLGYCRRECSTSRDCAAGLDCVLDPSGLGACQLPAETGCVLDSDCPQTLFCTMGECTNQCACEPDVPCRDCPPGATCVAREGGSRACLDPATRSCVWDSDCEAGEDSFVCAFDQRCRVECRTDLDCRFGAACTMVSFEEPGGTVTGRFCLYDSAPAAPDAGAPDGGP